MICLARSHALRLKWTDTATFHPCLPRNPPHPPVIQAPSAASRALAPLSPPTEELLTRKSLFHGSSVIGHIAVAISDVWKGTYVCVCSTHTRVARRRPPPPGRVPACPRPAPSQTAPDDIALSTPTSPRRPTPPGAVHHHFFSPPHPLPRQYPPRRRGMPRADAHTALPLPRRGARTSLGFPPLHRHHVLVRRRRGPTAWLCGKLRKLLGCSSMAAHTHAHTCVRGRSRCKLKACPCRGMLTLHKQAPQTLTPTPPHTHTQKHTHPSPPLAGP
jgi:hypothetical protein